MGEGGVVFEVITQCVELLKFMQTSVHLSS